jgi:hypothetical protein
MSLQEFFTKNIWGIIVFAVTATIFYASTSLRLDRVEVQAMEAKQEAASLRSLIDRIIVLEEREKGIVEDLKEIKDDIKEIKRLVK